MCGITPALGLQGPGCQANAAPRLQALTSPILAESVICPGKTGGIHMRCNRKSEELVRAVLELGERLVHDSIADHFTLHGIGNCGSSSQGIISDETVYGHRGMKAEPEAVL